MTAGEGSDKSRTSKDVQVRPYAPGDEDAIRELFEATYRRELSAEYWRWRFRDNPAGPAFIDLAWAGSTLAGHYAVTRLRMRVGGDLVDTGLSGTTMTHAEHRGGGLFPKLARATYARMADEGLGWVWGFPNTSSHRGFVDNLRWLDIYEIPTFEVVSANLDQLPEPGSDITEVATFDDRFDSLWMRIRSRYGVAVERNREYLTWRFRANPLDKYGVVVAAGKESLNGYAVFKRYADTFQIVDILHDDTDVGTSLVATVMRLAAAEGVKTVNTWLNPTFPLHRQLERWGFQPTRPVTYLGGAAIRPGSNDRFLDFRQWHFSMSDSDVY